MYELEFLPENYRQRRTRRRRAVRRVWIGLAVSGALGLCALERSISTRPAAAIARDNPFLTTPRSRTQNVDAKSPTTQADQEGERLDPAECLRQQAGQLQLQSTVMGASPRAVVNGELVAEGDVVACGPGKSRTAFRVLKIEARRIIVEREGIKLEIPMK